MRVPWHLIAAGLALAGIVALMAWPAFAHEFFTDTHDPVTTGKCCDGKDCRIVTADMTGVTITEVTGGYRVTVTAEQAFKMDGNSHTAVDEFVEWKRVQGGLSNGFAICIWYSRVQCFFAPSNV